uniref:Uncharacterized protein n=1 Tax=Ceratitis capitata TaxID=7213 RepID=W8BSY9_CERCA
MISKKLQLAKVHICIFQTFCKPYCSGYINQSLEVDEYFPLLDLNTYEYRTDTFDDEEEEDELKFSETDDGIDDVSLSDAELDMDVDDIYRVDYNEKADMNNEDENGLSLRLDDGKVTRATEVFAQARNTMITIGVPPIGTNN